MSITFDGDTLIIPYFREKCSKNYIFVVELEVEAWPSG